MKFCTQCGSLYVFLEENKQLKNFCKNCEHKEVSDEILIQTNVYKNSSSLTSLKNREDYIHDNTYPRTIYYNCPNQKCKTHSDKSIKEAIYFNENNLMKQTFICCTCLTEWKY